MSSLGIAKKIYDIACGDGESIQRVKKIKAIIEADRADDFLAGARAGLEAAARLYENCEWDDDGIAVAIRALDPKTIEAK